MIQKVINGLFTRFYLFLAGVWTIEEETDYDYSEYLGPNYKESEKSNIHVSTIVSNHSSWMDPIVHLKHGLCSFSPSEEYGKVPILRTCLNALDCVYVPRKMSTDESRKQAI